MTIGRIARLGALLFAGATATGCMYLSGLGLWPYEPWPDGEYPIPSPTVLATYGQGTATIVLEPRGQSETVTLDQVGPGSELSNDIGANVTWRNADGWVLQLFAYNYDGYGPYPPASGRDAYYTGDVTLQLIADHEVWRVDPYGPSGTRCLVTVDGASSDRISGSASCYDLRWSDGTAGMPFGEPAYVENEPPFDAEITFEARP